MHRFLGFLSFFTVICLVFAAAVQPLQCHVENEEKTPFQIKSNGNIVVTDKEFENFTEYFKSDYFKTSGKRCGVRHAIHPDGLDHILAAPTDCSLSGTVIQNEYWPAQAYIIPVVFHIIYKTDGTGNISDQSVYDQLEVLNDDYRALSGTLGELGFDTKIQFELAGITRTENTDWFNDNNEYTFKNTLGWDQDQYLNIYINSAGGYLGYAYLPQSSAGSVYDGVVVLYQSVGGRDNGFSPYDQGRTLVHEVGHYLGLLHTFDGYGCYEGYNAGDLVADTPSENTDHYGCTQTYTCGTADDIHNYMNYTDDPCMYQFTSEQANRMVCSLVNYRSQLASTASSLTLTSPNGGESWLPGTVRNITWDASGISANLKITLFKDGVKIGNIADGVSPASGSYSWTVGRYIGGTAAAGTGYAAKIKEIGTTAADFSDATFSISQLTVTSPDGGESWLAASSRDITWNAPGVTGNLKITLWKDGISLGIIADNVTPASGFYSWAVGQYDGGTASPGTGYTVKVKEKGAAVADVSNASFSITSSVSLTLTSPNGGENWQIGSTRDITWNAPGVSGTLKITLWKDGVSLGIIASGVAPGTGSYSWTVGQYVGGTASAGTGYTLKIKEKGTTVSDLVDGPFELTL